MNCPSCGHTNREAARFCDECGRSLAASVPRSAPTRRSYTPPHLVDAVLRTRSAVEGERKQVTVLFADLKGSMEIAEPLDPEVWHGILDGFFEILTGAVHRYEGTVNQYTGDGIMALFGAPIAHEDHAERACHAALAMRDQLEGFAAELRREHPFDFRARIGINSGEVVVGRIGDDLRMDYTAQGHSVGIASRVEQLAEPGDVYVAESTARLVEGLFELRDLGPRTLKGVREPVTLYALVGAGPLRTRLDRSRERGFSAFVGREAELAALGEELARVAAAKDAAVRVVAVVGEPGVGKSRLCTEFRSACERRGVRVVEAHALAHAQAIPLLPVVDLVRSSLGLPVDVEPGALRAAALDRLRALQLAEHPVPALVSELFGAEPASAEISAMDPEARAEQLFDALADLVTATPTRDTLVARLEDAQWIDAATARFLARLVERAGSRARLLLLLTLRGDANPPWLESFDCRRIALGALGSKDADALLCERLGERATAPDLHDLITRRARGNPLYIEEIVRSLVEGRQLVGSPGAYRLEVPVAQLRVPETVRAIVAARIDRLGDADKRVLQAAAVMGPHFASQVVREVVGLERASFRETLGGLLDGGYVEPREPDSDRGREAADLRFAHPLTQEVAYASQLSQTRRETHAAVAESLARLHADSLHRVEPLLAHHFEHAGRVLEAAAWHERAGRRIARADTAAGVVHCQKVVALLEGEPESVETLTLGLTSRIALLEIGRVAGMDEPDAERIFGDAKSVAERLGDPRGIAFLLTAYGRLQGLAGDVRTHESLCEQALGIARQSRDRRFEFEMLTHSLLSLLGVGRLEEAERRGEAGLAQLREDDLLSQSESTAPELCRIRSGWILAYRGRFDEAAQLLDPSDCSEQDRRRWEAVYGISGLRSDLAWLMGDVDQAVAHGERAFEIASRVGSAFARVEAECSLARARLLAGDVHAADTGAASALALARERRTALWYEPRLLAVQSEASLALGRKPEALELAREAVALSGRGRGWSIAECDAQLALARALAERGEVEAARGARATAEARARESGALAYRRVPTS